MIEDKEIGLKIAENPEEAFWEDIRKESKELIIQKKKELMLQEAILETAEKKIKRKKVLNNHSA